jgi:hypothetical protein
MVITRSDLKRKVEERSVQGNQSTIKRTTSLQRGASKMTTLYWKKSKKIMVAKE